MLPCTSNVSAANTWPAQPRNRATTPTRQLFVLIHVSFFLARLSIRQLTFNNKMVPYAGPGRANDSSGYGGADPHRANPLGLQHDGPGHADYPGDRLPFHLRAGLYGRD